MMQQCINLYYATFRKKTGVQCFKHYYLTQIYYNWLDVKLQ